MPSDNARNETTPNESYDKTHKKLLNRVLTVYAVDQIPQPKRTKKLLTELALHRVRSDP